MKKMFVVLLVVFLLLAMTACGAAANGPKDIPPAEDLTKEEAIPSPEADEDDDIIPLTQEEIQQVNDAFQPFVDGSANPLGEFLMGWYQSPELLDLTEFLRYHSAIYGSEEVTDLAEFEALKAHENWSWPKDAKLDMMPVPIHRIPAEEVEAVLQKYMGVGIGDIVWSSNSDLIYLEEYDCFYNFTSDAGFGVFECVDGFICGDDLVLNGRDRVLTMKNVDGNWLFYSLMPVEEELDVDIGNEPSNTEEIPAGYREVDFGTFSVFIRDDSFSKCAPMENVSVENNRFIGDDGENKRVIAELVSVEDVADNDDPFALYDERYASSVNTVELSFHDFAAKKYHIQTQSDEAAPVKVNTIYYCIYLSDNIINRNDKMVTFAYHPVMGLGGLHTEDIEAVLDTIRFFGEENPVT